MKILKLFALAAGVAAAFVSIGATSASATELLNGSGMVTAASTIAGAAEGTTVLHPPVGDIECSASEVEGTTSNTGSATETVKASLSKLTFTGCNATVTVLTKGELEIHAKEAAGSGTLTSTGTEVTVEFAGFHCIFNTSGTDIGTLTGSESTGGNATLDIEGMIPRTGGRSGAFCGTTAQWTGSYKITTPSTLNVHELNFKQISPAKFKPGEEVTLTAKNNGTTTWKWKAEGFEFAAGDFEFEAAETCAPSPRAPGQSCTRKLKCLKEANATWKLEVESGAVAGATIKREMVLECK